MAEVEDEAGTYAFQVRATMVLCRHLEVNFRGVLNNSFKFTVKCGNCPATKTLTLEYKVEEVDIPQIYACKRCGHEIWYFFIPNSSQTREPEDGNNYTDIVRVGLMGANMTKFKWNKSLILWNVKVGVADLPQFPRVEENYEWKDTVIRTGAVIKDVSFQVVSVPQEEPPQEAPAAPPQA